MKRFPVFLLSVLSLDFFVSCASVIIATDNDCSTDSLAVYKVTLDGNWDKDLFPRHYPENRPTAQFSKSFGRTHDAKYSMFSLGKLANPGLKQFCEDGIMAELENESVEKFDEFLIPHLKKPTHKVDTRVFVSSNYSMVSMITKLVPSPDWIIGVDSLNLCENNRWVENLTVEANPIDCGIDSGLTFTSPNWPTDPQDVIQKITAKYPRHQASSFHYKDIQDLPPIAYFKFHKVKEYVGVKEKSVKRIHQKFRRHDIRHKDHHNRSPSSNSISSEERTNPRQEVEVDEYEANSCVVSEWSEWSRCSKHCGLGEKRRERSIVKHDRDGGRICPALVEVKWCGSARGCVNGANSSSETYFKW